MYSLLWSLVYVSPYAPTLTGHNIRKNLTVLCHNGIVQYLSQSSSTTGQNKTFFANVTRQIFAAISTCKTITSAYKWLRVNAKISDIKK